MIHNIDQWIKTHKKASAMYLPFYVLAILLLASCAKMGLFNDWLKSKGKLGGQHKVPRLSNSRKNIDEILELNKL